jgi:hypothetical protein
MVLAAAHHHIPVRLGWIDAAHRFNRDAVIK